MIYTLLIKGNYDWIVPHRPFFSIAVMKLSGKWGRLCGGFTANNQEIMEEFSRTSREEDLGLKAWAIVKFRDQRGAKERAVMCSWDHQGTAAGCRPCGGSKDRVPSGQHHQT